MPTWDPAVYERYKAYRDRPALDLLTQIPRDLDPAEIWDLGCGTGEHTAVLSMRHLDANVYGLDSSPEMLAQARKRDAQVAWIEGDIAGFAPATPPDLIFTNAALQWLPDHGRLFPRLVETLRPGGVFACQIPVQFETTHHRIIRETAGQGPWADRMAAARPTAPAPKMERYYDWLSPLCDSIDLWSTAYIHVLEGDDAVLDWLSGTSLLPYVEAVAFEPELKAGFLAELRRRLAEEYPRRPDGTTLLPFERRFFVARRR